jgi:hypothetical protein
MGEGKIYCQWSSARLRRQKQRAAGFSREGGLKIPPTETTYEMPCLP